ncbi:MAG: K+/H+ antiporter subunit F [Chromatiaceae bacterium]|jgi:multicomponent K+:H+ antiporter subunit F|nr:K+/H+ antiporter subunit F [Chromatiaceae bacterium]
MLSTAVAIAFVLFGAALLLNAWRLLRGPDATDRILALDTLYINAVAVVILYGIHVGRPDFFAAALLIALLGFVSTIALAKFLLRGDIIE